MSRSRTPFGSALARIIAVLAVLAPATAGAGHSTGHNLWLSKCDTCHTTVPSGTQLNAGGSTATVLNHVIANQATMAGQTSLNATNLPSGDRALIAQYIRDVLPVFSTSTAFNTAKVISVAGHITLGTVSFSSVVVSNPPNGTATVSGTNITYTPDAGFVGNDSFTYRGGGPVAGDTRTITVTVNPPPPPVINSALTKAGTVGVALSYTITATNSPTSFGALSLPAGLSRVGSLISGTPTTAGLDNATITATNAGGTDSETLAFNIAKGTQTITFNPQMVGSRTYAAGSSFTLNPTASASSQLAITYTTGPGTVCTNTGTTIFIQGAGTCTITAAQAGDLNWNPAASVQRTVSITPASQTVTFAAQTPPSRAFVQGGNFTVSPLATASSGLAITYGTTTPTVCSASGSTISILSAGTCTISANQPGNTNFAAAPQQTQDVTITAIAPGAPTGVVGTAGVLQATLSFSPPASSGGSPITGYRGTCNPGGFTNTAAASPVTVTGLTNGVAYSCVVRALTTAFPGGGADSNPAVSVTPSAAPVAPAITSAAGTTFTIAAAGSFNVTATGNPVPTVSISSGALPAGLAFNAAAGSGVGTISGTPASGSAGTYNLTMAASSSTAPAASQPFVLTVARRSQTITFVPPPDQPFTPVPILLEATSSLGLAVGFETTTPEICEINKEGLLQLLDAGECTIVAIQPGNADVLPAGSDKQVVLISPAEQTITFGAQAAHSVSEPSFVLDPVATASSGLEVAYSTTTPAVCSVAGTLVMPISVGTCTVTASQGGDSRYLPATDVTQGIAIGLASQSITFLAQVPATRTFVPGGTFQVNPLASASSGLAVAYSSLTPACTVSGSTVTMVSPGACTIAANQPGNAMFAAAAQVTSGLTINAAVPGAPVIGVATPGNTQATVEFAPPASDGGSPVTGYTVTCNPGNRTAAGTASPLTVTGLTNGTTYSCSVTATNATGTGAASASVSVTPAASAGAGATKWADNCQACHGPVPGGTRFNAVADSLAVLNHIFTAQPVMAANAPLQALSEGDRADILAYIAGFLPGVQANTAPGVAKAVSVATNITLNSSAGTYTAITVVTPPAHGTLSAFNGTSATYTPAPGYSGPDSFTYRAVNAGNPALLSNERTVTLNVNAAQPVLTKQVVGPGTGVVNSLPEGTSCTSDCNEAYEPDTVVMLEASPTGGSVFGGWGGACSGTAGCIVGMDTSKVVSATFQLAPGSTFPLTVQRTGTGTGTVTSNPAGIACGVTCAADFAASTPVTLEAAPAAGSVFVQWSGACAGNGACQVTMDGARDVTATFALSPGVLATATTAVDFGGQSMGTTSPPMVITFTNPGASALTVTQVAASNPQFGVQSDCATLMPAQSCTAVVTFSPSAVGAVALNGTVAVAGTLTISHNGQGVQALPLAGTAEKSLVTHYYNAILRRAPDSGGHAFWTAEAARMQGLQVSVNETWFSMAAFFFFSGEYQSFGRDNAGFVTDLYRTFFNRAPDDGGLAFWVGLLDSGIPREVILVQFMFSAEFVSFTQGIFGNVGARAEVDVVMDFFRGLLSRLPDTAGLQFWVGRFRQAQCTGPGAVFETVEDIASQFALGAEYGARARSNPQYVGDLYNAFLRRGGDSGGVFFWIGQLGAGVSREDVRRAFINTPEFNARVNAVVAQGCLQ